MLSSSRTGGFEPLLTMSVRMPAGMNMKKTLARNVTYAEVGNDLQNSAGVPNGS
jgi:hypothetical protein